MAKVVRILFVIAALLCGSLVLTIMPSTCTECLQSASCQPPNCFCCREELRLPNISLSQIPQIVFFTFDDAVTPQASGFYYQLFHESRKNPNKCPITMTLFISHENTKYGLVTEFHRKGMEIASHSVTHSTMNGSNFFEEAKSQKENLAKLAQIPIDEITGWRSPFLKPAGDLQPDALKKLGYTYDATLTFSKRSFREKPPGPFTLDFGYPYECQVKPCPQHKHPGFWEVPVVSLLDYKQAYDCVYVDGCMNAPPNEDAAYQFLWDNFHNYYTTTRMPFGINMHPSWFYYPDRLNAMDRFIQKLVSLNDVYIVSANRMLEWLKRPTPLQDLHSFAPWACDGSEKSFDSGPRFVKKTHLPPPPPRSFISWTNNPPVPNFTPAPPASQQSITQTKLFTPPDMYSNESTRFIPNPNVPRNHLFTLDLTQNGVQQNQRQQSDWSPRQTSPPQLISIDPNLRVRIRRPDHPPPIVPPAIRLSQQERLDQHEEQMRQRRIYEENKRAQEILEQRRQQQLHQELLEQQRQQELAEQQRLQALRQQQAVTRAAQQRVLWEPAAFAPDSVHESSRSNENRQQPTRIHQETIKLWPHLSQIFRVPDQHTIDPQNNVNSVQRERFDVRQVIPEQNVIVKTNTGSVDVTPAPVQSITRNVHLHTESPRHTWHSDMRSRFGPMTNGPIFTRGGSNRRPGFVPTTPPPPVSSDPRHLPRMRQSHVIVSNDTLNQIRERDERIRQQIIDSRRRRVNIDVNSRMNNDVINIESRERTPGEIPPPSMGIYPRNVLHPSVAQQLAWNSFIRQMLGAH